MSASDTTTRAGEGRLLATKTSSVPALTILWHPDVRRVGERALLVDAAFGTTASVSRNAPLFGPPNTAPSEPLGDNSVSRTPLHICPGQGEFTLRCERPSGIRVDGRPLKGGEATIPESLLDEGVVVELSDDVSLVLHRATPRDKPLPSLGLVGESDAVQRLREQVLAVAEHDVPVLLLGESGSGKELIARALHEQSSRRQRSFVSLSLAAINPSTAASALFGHKKGAFTGASEERKGCFEHAHGGTLFLDEVGCAPAELQASLLRTLETGEVQTIGAAAYPRVDVRIVAATDADLERAVSDGRFSLALLHRLRGYEIRLPALRERRSDMGSLLKYFLEVQLARQGRADRLAPRADQGSWLPSPLVAELTRHEYSGNIRELRNIAGRLAIDWGSHTTVALESAQSLVGTQQPRRQPEATVATLTATPAPGASDADVLVAWKQAGWNVGRAAKRVGLSRTTVYEILRRSGHKTAADLTPEEIDAQLREAGGDVGKAAEGLRVTERALQLRLTQLGDAAPAAQGTRQGTVPRRRR